MANLNRKFGGLVKGGPPPKYKPPFNPDLLPDKQARERGREREKEKEGGRAGRQEQRSGADAASIRGHSFTHTPPLSPPPSSRPIYRFSLSTCPSGTRRSSSLPASRTTASCAMEQGCRMRYGLRPAPPLPLPPLALLPLLCLCFLSPLCPSYSLLPCNAPTAGQAAGSGLLQQQTPFGHRRRLA